MVCCTGKEAVMTDEEGGVCPSTSRKCRDVLCIVLFGVFWAGMLVVAILGFKSGDPYRLLYATDYNGTTCGAGKNNIMVDKPLIYYPKMNDDLLFAMQNNISPLDTDFYGICVTTCPAAGTYICNYQAEADVQASSSNITEQRAERKRRAEITFGTHECWFVPLKSDDVFFRCLPAANVNSTSVEKCVHPADEEKYYHIVHGKRVPNELCEVKEITTVSIREAQAQPNPMIDQLQQTGAIIGRWIGDIAETYNLIFAIGGGVAFVAGCLFLVFLRYCAGCMIWVVCWGLVLAMLVLSCFLGLKGGVIPNQAITSITEQIVQAELTSGGDTQLPAELQVDEARIVFYQIASYVAFAFTLILFMVVCFARKKIKVTIGILREASRALGRLPLLVFFPLIPFVFIVTLFVYWIVIASFIYSSGGIAVEDVASVAGSTTGIAMNSTSIQVVKPDTSMRILFAYHFFGFLWTNQLIQAISMTTMAGAVCKYYWARDKTSEEMGRFPILTSFKNCFRYHLGSLIFGSFIIAVVQFIRAVLMYIDKQTKKMQDTNLVMKVVMKAMHCCLWCLEKCIKFISKNAYIMIAMKGKSFCSSTKEAFFTIFANIGQVGMVAAVSSLLLLLAKVTISVGCGILIFVAIDKNPDFAPGGVKELTSPVVPILLTLLFAWFVANTFMDVYAMTIDTILLCFCEDKKINATSGKFYMSEELQKYVDKYSK